MVSIIILSYNTKDLLHTCITSVRKHVTTLPIEIIVVDNNSSDDSVKMIKKEFPFIKVIESRENLGFSKGINLGAEHAKGEYLLFLNSDCEFLDNSFEYMISFMEKHTQAGIVGGKMENNDGSMQRSYNNFYGIKDIAIMLFGREKAELLLKKGNEEQETDWVSGGFMLVRSSIFKQVKGFDEHIFMYTEDMELCFRVKKLGYKIYYFPDARVRHEGQGSSDRSFAVIHIYKGIRYFYKKHRSIVSYAIIFFLLLIKAALAIIIGTVSGNKKLITTYIQAITA